MKNIIPALMTLIVFTQASYAGQSAKSSRFNFTGPNSASLIRGFNYNPPYGILPHHRSIWWVKYDSSTIAFDLNLAKRLDLNQTRVFVPYSAYLQDKKGLRTHLREFVRACHERGIGVMVVVGKGPWVKDTTLRPEAVKWAEFLINAISKEPGLRMWDVMNEPDWPPTPKASVSKRLRTAEFMAETFHRLDHNTPVTIGMAFVKDMIKLGKYVDVLEFHNYLQTRSEIRNAIDRAKAYAEKVHKPLIDGEIGCVGRANPYDVALEENMKAKVGWYIWELMIVPNGWGPEQGVFYANGTVRDPSIPAAIMGFFRKRSGKILPSVPDMEGWVTRIIDRGDKWLSDTSRTWNGGLKIAEIQANLLEAGQLVAMRVPPSWEVWKVKHGEVDMSALEKLIIKFNVELEPYRIPPTGKH